MLCRTASELYWMSRHIERAENTARLIDLTQRIALLPERLERGKAGAACWLRALEALGVDEEYLARHDKVDGDDVLRFLTLDPANPSSIYSCLQLARESGRAQRGAITAEMYQDLNASWLEILGLNWEQLISNGVSPFLDWVKTRSASFRGVTVGTMGRDEAYDFLRLGTFVERADCTVRMLDIKYAEAHGEEEREARSAVQYYQWSALLHAISAFETYRKIYKDTIQPVRVAELIILRDDMPRSLAVCCNAIHATLTTLAGGAKVEAIRLSGALAAEVRFARIDAILAQGMHEYLTHFLERTHQLADEIGRQFMWSTDLAAA
ncbi:MAG: alpha-E domain-containing protein [Tahibacter sp.]